MVDLVGELVWQGRSVDEHEIVNRGAHRHLVVQNEDARDMATGRQVISQVDGH